jgi:hypothetical protein
VSQLRYLRRFLLEKDPHLVEDEARSLAGADLDGLDGADETISVLNEIVEAGGPDLR